MRHGNRPACWNAMPYAWSFRACAAEVPFTSTVPALGSSRSAMRRMSVDLPQPDGPMRETNSPAATSRSMPWRACTTPDRVSNVLSTPVTRTAAVVVSVVVGAVLMR
ncbi:hypothetical protein GCM10025877_13180 [Agromyces mangrovi Wang et al. 2018]|nr:hypothetical protein GCM10025877_13180 [Agromyces mangrovi]